MASLMSKRQQARNEKALQELVHDIPGNNFCADCSARNPAWASWSLGVFLCMRCAAIHRKLGTHISKVKSLSMDGWTNEQVENMRRVGNSASNKEFNPDNKKPPVPVDADEADSAMERFIRAKYTPKTTPLNGGTLRSHHTGHSIESDDGPPPPPPPKTGVKFFSKAKSSSTFPISFRSKKNSHQAHEQYSPGGLRRKTSKVFSTSVYDDDSEEIARKLSQLRDMGFVDDKRNAMVLKGVNGNIEKTIETLVRLGEGGGRPSTSLVSSKERSLPTPNTLTTTRSLSPAPATPTTAGLSRTSPSNNSPAISNNPWDISPAQPQSSQSTGTLPNRNPFYSTNPFGPPAHQVEFNMNQSMQNLSLSSPQQQLFPHHTGGLPATQPFQHAVYQQSMTPPIPQMQDFTSVAFNNNQAYQQPFQQVQQQQQPQQQSYNPFLQSPTSQQPLSLNTQPQGNYGANPFMRSPNRVASPTLGQIPEQSQQNFYGTPQSTYASNPFFATGQLAHQPQLSPQPAQPYDQSWFQPQQQQQTIPQARPMYQIQRDKASIMALYNYPSMAASPVQPPEQNGAGGIPAQLAPHLPTSQAQPPQSPPRTNAQPGSKNPFLNGSSSPPPVASYAGTPAGGARSRESMTLGFEMAWNNGRHSPDAFASLSARGA